MPLLPTDKDSYALYCGNLILVLFNCAKINPIALRKAKMYKVLAFLNAIGLRYC